MRLWNMKHVWHNDQYTLFLSTFEINDIDNSVGQHQCSNIKWFLKFKYLLWLELEKTLNNKSAKNKINKAKKKCFC